MAAWQEMFLHRESGGGHGGNLAALVIHRVGQSLKKHLVCFRAAKVALDGCLQAPVLITRRMGRMSQCYKGQKQTLAAGITT